MLAEIAQLVEHATENRGVPSPILGLGTPVKMFDRIRGRSTVVVRLLAKNSLGDVHLHNRQIQANRLHNKKHPISWGAFWL